jgi:hypothetical protein
MMSSIETNNDSKAPYPAHAAGYGPANPEEGVLNVNKALGVLVGGALVAGVVLAAASTGWAGIAGKVLDGVGAPVPNARVEVWDAYPGGSVLTFGATDAQGGFSLSSVPPALFDLRVIKPASGIPEYYPTVIRGLPDPVTNVLAFLFPVGTTLPSSTACEFWDTSSTFLGAGLKPGDVLEAFDPDGVLCGLAMSNSSGHFNITVIGDDGLGGVDEGPFNGELVDFTINGFPATPPATFASLEAIQHPLTGATSSHGVTVTSPTGADGMPGDLALISLQFTNTGSVTDSFEVDASIAEGWPITFPPAKLPSYTLLPGGSATVDILVHIPPGVGDTTVTVAFKVRSRTYGSIAAGSITTLSVAQPTAVWDGGDGGLLPTRFSLAQNYPNPFNPETEIAFSLRVEGNVRLEIFNLLGQSVTVLLDGYHPQGITVAHWDGRDSRGAAAPTGFYFYRLTQDGQSLVRKMVLLK